MKKQHWPNTHNVSSAMSAPEFSEAEIGALTEVEYEAAQLRHERFLDREQEEMETLEQEFDEELNHLFSLTRDNEMEGKLPEPSDWPEL